MNDFYEIDFVKAGENKSGDAIALRYSKQGESTMFIHIVDGGYTDDGQKLVDHINHSYDNPERIDNVVLTHPDGDHAAGLETILEAFEVGTLWMNRPWNHVADLLPRFEYDYTEKGLAQRLKKDFPHTASLEKIAEENEIEIRDAFQGEAIGEFVVLSPSLSLYLDLIIESEKTPEPEREASLAGKIYEAVREAVEYVASFWGAENLKGNTEGTSAENEMSIVQYINLNNEKILLTGDAGVRALEEAYNYAVQIGVQLPGINKFQVPHHGSRRNLSTEILNIWLREKLLIKPSSEQKTFTAMISAHENDPDHPKKAVVRALWHRGAHVASTEDKNFIYFAPSGQLCRHGCEPIAGLDYPEDMEN